MNGRKYGRQLETVKRDQGASNDYRSSDCGIVDRFTVFGDGVIVSEGE
jgi:hypothetical protein